MSQITITIDETQLAKLLGHREKFIMEMFDKISIAAERQQNGPYGLTKEECISLIHEIGYAFDHPMGDETGKHLSIIRGTNR